jgi:hypothetical protein
VLVGDGEGEGCTVTVKFTEGATAEAGSDIAMIASIAKASLFAIMGASRRATW